MVFTGAPRMKDQETNDPAAARAKNASVEVKASSESPSASTSAATSPVLPRVARGDASAVRECIDRYGGLVYSIASRFCRDKRDVEDACQDIFLDLWKNASSFDPARGCAEATFIALIARRRLIDRSRLPRTKPLPGIAEDPDAIEIYDPAKSDARRLDDYVDAKVALLALHECSAAEQKVILLCAVQGWSHNEIATELSLPLGTVKSHYTRGIEKVKRALSLGKDSESGTDRPTEGGPQ